MASLSQILAGITLAAEALSVVPEFQAALKDGELTPEEIDGIVAPLVQTISGLVKHSLPPQLVVDIEKAVADAVTAYYKPKVTS